jgi:hypothetical protein
MSEAKLRIYLHFTSEKVNERRGMSSNEEETALHE